jgi:hypothetical protein
MTFRQALINRHDVYVSRNPNSSPASFDINNHIPVDIVEPTFELDDYTISCFDNIINNIYNAKSHHSKNDLEKLKSKYDYSYYMRYARDKKDDNDDDNNNKINQTYNYYILPDDPQYQYWFIFESTSRKYYAINLHPNPVNQYAMIDEKTITYLKIRKHLIIPGHRMIPKISWLIPANEIEEEKHAYELTDLHERIMHALKSYTAPKYIHRATQLCYKIPDDIILPQPTDSVTDPIDIIVSAYIYNLDYGQGNVVKAHHHSQYKYWFPIVFDYDSPLVIYMINLHPEPDFVYGIRTIYRATDYSSGSDGNFKKISYDDIVKNVGKKLVPVIHSVRPGSRTKSAANYS